MNFLLPPPPPLPALERKTPRIKGKLCKKFIPKFNCLNFTDSEYHRWILENDVNSQNIQILNIQIHMPFLWGKVNVYNKD